ncbi:hypothetical protein [Kibdelosporangium phytohabitans]|uniref:hypothetical protein n=1 Tax=Kibdelosporangium phytohabitans TaxID=860235 RepID=UPI001A028AA4|nr:hypothetical protein [Kibdelosporangium phytohabitans]MBE1463019.1 hypothetical protein [Kibdelosporangium phytohabitans]
MELTWSALQAMCRRDGAHGRRGGGEVRLGMHITRFDQPAGELRDELAATADAVEAAGPAGSR